MYKHAEKLEFFFKNRAKAIECYNLKYLQMLYQGFYVILIGAVAYGSPGSCSAPIQIFLQGLFSMYIFAFILNFFVFLVRMLKKTLIQSSYSRTMKLLNLRMDMIYFPLYWAFSILEFCWYVIGFKWVTDDNNCLSAYSSGMRLSQALLAFWLITMTLILILIVSLNMYLCCRAYNGSQSLGAEVVMNSPAYDVRSHPEILHKPDFTVSNTPARVIDD